MIEIFKEHYWSKSEAFLFPLTGLPKTSKYHYSTYLFWNEYSIENYQLIVKFTWDDYDEFLKYCKVMVFPVLDVNGYLIESYDSENETIFVLDLSEWALDIELFLSGKYSKFSNEAKKKIEKFHTYMDKIPKIKLHIAVVLAPNTEYEILGKMKAIDYAAKVYNLPLDELQRVGELGGKYQIEAETLELEVKNA